MISSGPMIPILQKHPPTPSFRRLSTHLGTPIEIATKVVLDWSRDWLRLYVSMFQVSLQSSVGQWVVLQILACVASEMLICYFYLLSRSSPRPLYACQPHLFQEVTIRCPTMPPLPLCLPTLSVLVLAHLLFLHLHWTLKLLMVLLAIPLARHFKYLIIAPRGPL